MADIKLRDRDDNETVYEGISTVTLPTADSSTQTFVLDPRSTSRSVPLDMAEGDQEIDAEDGSYLGRVVILKPATLAPENIVEGIDIGGVVGTRSTPELSPPTITATNEGTYNTLAVKNPIGNGKFAKQLRCYVNGELVTTKTPAQPDAELSFADVSLYNGVEGEQTLSFEYAADGFKTSSIVSRQANMIPVTLNPESVQDGYSYPAVKAGATYEGTITEKNESHGYLPLAVDVRKNGVPCEHEWEYDTGLDTTLSGGMFVTRYRNGKLVVENVDHALDITIPYTEKPKLAPPNISDGYGSAVVEASPYAQSVSVQLDGEDYAETVGITYTLEGVSNGEHEFSLKSGAWSAETGGVPQAYFSNGTSGSYKLCKLRVTATQSTSLSLRCFFVSESPTNNYAILSKLDTELTAGVNETSSYIQKSFSGLSSTEPQFVTYSIPAGEHFICAKLRIGTANAGQTMFGFMPYRLCGSTTVAVEDYLPHTASAIAHAEDCLDSDPEELTFQLKPELIVFGDELWGMDILSAVERVRLYINDQLVSDDPYSEDEGWYKSFDELPAIGGRCRMYIETIGPNVNARSNTVRAYITEAPIYGVSGLYQSDPVLTRTDDAVGLDYIINADGTIQSDFNSVFPWTDAVLVTDTAGNRFIQMPEMYFRVNADSSKRITDIAVSATTHEGDNWYYVEPFCYGLYSTNANGGTKLVSKSGITPTGGATRANLRTYARNNGNGYEIDDLYHKTVMKFLWWIEFATKNAASIMTGCAKGTGTTGGQAAVASGGTDSLTTPSGWELSRAQMRWHYIEDFYGGLSEILDGVYMTALNTASYATMYPSFYGESTSGKSQLSYKNPAYNYCIMAYGWDSSHPFLCLPCESTSTAVYTGYFCTRAYNYSSSYVVLMEGSNYLWNEAGNGEPRNGFIGYSLSSASAVTNYGCRLVYHGQLEVD